MSDISQNKGNSPWSPEYLPHLDGKTIVITGASSGIGFEAAVFLPCRGFVAAGLSDGAHTHLQSGELSDFDASPVLLFVVYSVHNSDQFPGSSLLPLFAAIPLHRALLLLYIPWT